MTLLTDDGKDWYGTITNPTTSTDDIASVAIGSGSGSENVSATSLGNREYIADYQDAPVDFIDGSALGEVTAVIEVTGGTEIPAGTTITEMAVLAGLSGSTSFFVYVDEFSGVTVQSGSTRSFELTYNHTR